MPKGKSALWGIIGLLILLVCADTSFSSVNYTPLSALTSSLKTPEDVAVGPDGKIYVVDGYQSKVFIYDRKGSLLGSIASIQSPTSVAVSSEGRIYIGSNYDLSVKILNSSYKITGMLGGGKNEFQLPRNIAVDSQTGEVYVVDQLAGAIRIYTSEGAYLREIPDLQNEPQDVAFAGDELCVIDYPRMRDYMGGIMRGARIQAFGPDGYPLSEYRYGESANSNRNLALGNVSTVVPPLEGPQRYRINAGGVWSGTGREVIRVYTGVYGDYVYGETPAKNPYRNISANAKTHITVYMSETGTSAGVYAELYEYNDTDGTVGGAKGTTVVQAISQANGNAQEFDLTFNNAAFTVGKGNRLVVRYYFNAENAEPALLYGSVYGATTPAGATYMTLNEYFPNTSYGLEKRYYLWNTAAADVGADGTTNVTQLASRSFGSFGLGLDKGEFVNPVGIAADDDGVLYITDSRHGVVMSFDSADGTYLGAIYDPSVAMSVPKGIDLGADGRMLVTSMNTSRVNIFGLEGYVSMGTAPSSMTFQGQQGMADPSGQTLTVSNTGTGTLTYHASTASEWIVLNETDGSVGPGGSRTLTVGVSMTNLSAGSYHGTITVTDTVSGARDEIAVTLEVKAPLQLSVSPVMLTYSYVSGTGTPASRGVEITLSNDTEGTAAWTAASDAGWLSISPSGMTGSAAAEVSVQPMGLEAGAYTGHIVITASGAAGSPAEIMVTLEVKAAGRIAVSSNTEQAAFSITGPAQYEGSGASWTTDGVPDGTYTITYYPVTGYKAPLAETKELADGGQISFTGEYKSLAMSAGIIVSRGGAKPQQAGIGIFGGSGEMLDYFDLVPGSGRFSYLQGASTAAGDIDGDGSTEIVAGYSSDRRNPAVVSVYRTDGSVLKDSTFMAMYSRYGANVAAADFDGDGRAEIIVGAGASEDNRAQVRVFSYDGGTVRDKGINLIAFDGGGGVNVAAGDVDGDGVPELITAAGASAEAAAEIRVWKIDTSGDGWSIEDTGIDFVAFTGYGVSASAGSLQTTDDSGERIRLYSDRRNKEIDFMLFKGRYGAYVATGDINGDGRAEIIAGSGPDPKGGANRIKVFNGDGTEFGLELSDGTVGYGLRVASADLDSDGVAEIIAGAGPSPENAANVTVYKSDGTAVAGFTAFEDTGYGAVISTGDLGY